jgi:hypothetical protein
VPRFCATKSEAKNEHLQEGILDLELPENIAAIDIGFSKSRRTTGVGLLHLERDLRRVCGVDAATTLILMRAPFTIIAIDGPIIPEGQSSEQVRPVERAFCKGFFQGRCKPGMSHVPCTGKQLRSAAGEAADGLAAAAPLSPDAGFFPLVRNGSIIEAFPNAFLGVCLDDSVYAAAPNLKRGKKFDWLYDEWVGRQPLSSMSCLRDSEKAGFQEWLKATKNHEERAALICILTALLTARGNFTAVGEETGGWFFLPPLSIWASWAKTAIHENVAALNRETGSRLRIIQSDSGASHAPQSSS